MAYPLLLGGRLNLEAFLWPLVTVTTPASGGFLANVGYYAVRFVAFLGTGRGAV
jgi:acyl dehydratase